MLEGFNDTIGGMGRGSLFRVGIDVGVGAIGVAVYV